MKRAGLVFAVVALNHFFMIVRDLLLAHQFGNHPELNAFLTTMIVPGFLLNVFTGAMSNSLVPKIVEEKSARAPALFGEYLMNLIYAMLFSLALLSAVLWISSPLWHEPLILKMSEESRLLARSLLRPTMAIFFLQMSPVFFRVLFTACGHARFATLGPLMNSLALACALFFAPPLDVASYLSELGGAYLLELAFLFAGSVWFFQLPLLIRPSLSGVRDLIDRHFLFPASSSVLTAFSLMFDQALAARLDPVGVVALGYGQKITSSVIGVLAGGMSLLIYPEFAKHGTSGQWEKLKRRMRRLGIGVFAGSTVLALLLAAFSAPCIRILFERGAFRSEDTLLVARINACYLLQIPFYLTTQIGLKGLYSMRKGVDITKIAFINVFLNAAGDILLSRLLGVAGIALATSGVAAFSLLAVFYFVRRTSAHENKDADQRPVHQSHPA